MSKEFNSLMLELIPVIENPTQYESIANKMATNLMIDNNMYLTPGAFEFMNHMINIHEEGKNTLEFFYPVVLNTLLTYTENIKISERDQLENTSLRDIIVNFAFFASIEIEIIGDMCANDAYFRKFIERENDLINGDHSGSKVMEIFNW